MKTAKDLSKAIKQLVGNSDKVIATVTSVDKNLSCCDVEIDGNELGNVRLQAIVKENVKGCKLYPAVGSKVVVEQLNDKGDWMVTMLSEIEEVLFEVGDLSFKMNAEGIVFNGGDFGGLVKLESTVDRLNILEQDLNSLKNAFSTWVVVPSDGGAALKAATATWVSNQLEETINSDLENQLIKQ
jgi:hypothetical protein